jgi:hypothetical protein
MFGFGELCPPHCACICVCNTHLKVGSQNKINCWTPIETLVMLVPLAVSSTMAEQTTISIHIEP